MSGLCMRGKKMRKRTTARSMEGAEEKEETGRRLQIPLMREQLWLPMKTKKKRKGEMDVTTLTIIVMGRAVDKTSTVNLEGGLCETVSYMRNAKKLLFYICFIVLFKTSFYWGSI